MSVASAKSCAVETGTHSLRVPRRAVLLALVVFAACEDDDLRHDASKCREAARAALEGRPVTERDLESGLRELRDCRAVALDDVGECDRVAADLRANCRARWRFFHDARAEAPDWRAVMAAALRVECTAQPEIAEEACAALHMAVARRDPERCPSAGGIRTLCVGIASADPSKCEGDSDCEELAGRLRLLLDGAGLEGIAREGTLRDRATAAAALRGLDACEALVPPFVSRCE